MSDQKDTIRVVLRLRNKNGSSSCVVAVPKANEVQVHPSESSASAVNSYLEEGKSIESLPPSALSGAKRFTFDSIFDGATSQAAIFEAIGLRVISQAVEGFNATVLSYGQTGSGKTYTMIGPNGGSAEVLSDATQSTCLGLVPRILSGLFDRLSAKKSSGGYSFEVKIGAVELYNEALRDLAPDLGLTDSLSSQMDLKIREDRSPGGKGIYIEGMCQHSVQSTQQAMEIVKIASTKKTVGATKMNDTSSRSHTIVVLNISQTDHVRHETKINSQIFLVDLAGSERIEKTGAAGERLKEAQNINLSLTLLGNVISKLTDGKSLHIPYRDAKLTRLLQDSLGGNAITTLICTCSSDKQHLSETTSTLQFAQRAKSIKNQPVANVVRGLEEVAKELASANMEVKSLKRKLQLLEMGNITQQDAEGDQKVDLKSILLEMEQLREELASAQKENGDLREEIAFYKNREQSANDELTKMQMQATQDRAAAEAATEKLTELLKTVNTTSSHDIPLKEVNRSTKASLASKGSPKPPPTQRRANSTIGIRSSSESQLAPSPITVATFSEDNPISAVKSEALALVRERMLLAQIDTLRKELDDHKKFAILVDRERAENVELKLKHQRETEDLITRYERTLSLQDGQITALSAEVTKGKEGQDASIAEIEKLKKSIEELTQPLVAAPKGTSEGQESLQNELRKISDERAKKWILRLEEENKELHTENRLNGMRMMDLTKRIDETQNENRQLQDDRDAMRRHIEVHTMEDGVLKTKLMKLLTKSEKDKQQERSYFRKRLLDCFSTE